MLEEAVGQATPACCTYSKLLQHGSIKQLKIDPLTSLMFAPMILVILQEILPFY